MSIKLLTMTSTRTKQRRIMEELDSYNFQQLHESPVRVNNTVNGKLLEVDSLPLNNYDLKPQQIRSKVS